MLWDEASMLILKITDYHSLQLQNLLWKLFQDTFHDTKMSKTDCPLINQAAITLGLLGLIWIFYYRQTKLCLLVNLGAAVIAVLLTQQKQKAIKYPRCRSLPKQEFAA